MSDPKKFTFFPPGQSPTELKADPFLGRFILPRVQDWIIREAERREDTWRFLLGVRDLHPDCYGFFRAAESLSRAMNHVLQMLYGGATLPRYLPAEMTRLEREGDVAGARRIAKKLVRAQIRHGLWFPWTDEDRRYAGEANLRTLEALAGQARADLEKRHGKNFVVPVKTMDQFSAQHEPFENRIIYMMIDGWLRLGPYGDPGLCYFSDHATTRLLEAVTKNDMGCNVPYFRKIRQRLGLHHANARHPIVIDARRLKEGPRHGQIELQMKGVTGVVSGSPGAHRCAEALPASWRQHCVHSLPWIAQPAHSLST